ncbi:regulatory signaling modulator protein AmpE [Curvibacter sp. APW13]|uniref:regulatory signaling modulator protein AmpE n=1 Tax=Curvibacter sp. APW13 TaxID=3077236 RepID=UPI0028E099EA|nr:regulatory signaling modulator protein AmpE [Curvibacter sp. APW13]MDT8989383.1 regulatory signaling modulator protein AmpE [Curvibacter sp. APW13]
MSFVSILLALLLEQARPLSPGNPVHGAARDWLRWVGRNFDTGANRHTALAWGLSALFPALVALAVHWALLWTFGWAVAVVWSVVVLYATLGFRQFSFHFTEVRDALDAGDVEQARAALARWMRRDASELPKTEIVREVIAHSVLSAHRHVFGVLAWYTVLAAFGFGPAGAVFYRMAAYTQEFASRPLKPSSQPVSAAFIERSRHAWYAVDWVPVRLTALFFAFVGSFEEAVDAWRQHAQSRPHDNDGVVLAATAGAVNVRLEPAGAGAEPQVSHLRAVVGLVWRTVVMWMVFLALISVARVLG